MSFRTDNIEYEWDLSQQLPGHRGPANHEKWHYNSKERSDKHKKADRRQRRNVRKMKYAN